MSVDLDDQSEEHRPNGPKIKPMREEEDCLLDKARKSGISSMIC